MDIIPRKGISWTVQWGKDPETGWARLESLTLQGNPPTVLAWDPNVLGRCVAERGGEDRVCSHGRHIGTSHGVQVYHLDAPTGYSIAAAEVELGDGAWGVIRRAGGGNYSWWSESKDRFDLQVIEKGDIQIPLARFYLSTRRYIPCPPVPNSPVTWELIAFCLYLLAETQERSPAPPKRDKHRR